MVEKIAEILLSIKQTRPLILNITNYVSMEFVANGLLSLGACPIMIHSKFEAEEIVKNAAAVVINIGTLDADFIALSEEVCQAATLLGKPLILDPVGVGATKYRTEVCLNFLEKFKFAIIRGNASEIMALCGTHENAKGVDSTISVLETIESAKLFSLHRDLIIAISGAKDAVIKGETVTFFERGSSLMPMITGSGCLLSSVISAFQAVYTDPYIATCAAVYFYSVCGERATVQALGPGSFKSNFLDQLSFLPKREDYEKQ